MDKPIANAMTRDKQNDNGAKNTAQAPTTMNEISINETTRQKYTHKEIWQDMLKFENQWIHKWEIYTRLYLKTIKLSLQKTKYLDN